MATMRENVAKDRGAALAVLVVDDDAAWAARVGRAIAGLGWSYEWVHDLPSAMAAACRNCYQLVVLDRMFGDGAADGLTLLQQFAALEVTPAVLVISNLAAPHDRVAGLDAGADDYLSKPFDNEELRARLQALARRAGHLAHYPTVHVVGDLELRRAARSASWQGMPLDLTPQQFDLLRVLAENAPEPVSRAHLWNEVWRDYRRLPPQDGVIDVALSRLRQQLRAASGRDVIVNERGRGYRLDV